MEPTKAILMIDKLDSNPIPFVYLTLDQYLFKHSRVEIKIDLKDIGENVLSAPMQKTSLINSKFQIDIQVGDDAGAAYGFLGLITDVQVKLDEGDHGWLYIYGASRSIELERGRMYQTFSNVNLEDIVSEVTQGLLYLEMTNDPEYTENIKFSMQYKETDYQYLQRLAWMYRQSFFFSGDSLVFGKFSEKDTAKVTYDLDLKEVSLNSRLISNKFIQYYHDLKEEKKTSEHEISQGGTFTGEASAQADLLNAGKKPEVPVDAPVSSEGELKQLTEMRTKSNFNRMFYVSGKSKLYKIRIGSKLEIAFHKKMVVDEMMGTLRVTRVCHSFDEQNRYENYFEACQTQFADFPYDEIEIPNAQPIEATVVANVDPDGLGKVQLQFDFEKKVCDHWFRCMLPDAGGNKNTGEERNRGFGVVPEIKDRVLVGFLGGNPDKPFVLGSLFHGNNAENIGGGEGNPVRFFRDKSGSEIVMNDKEGSIKHFSKKGKSTVFIDGKGNVSISTPGTITLSAANINLNAGNSINLKAKPQKEGKGEGLIDLTAQKSITVTSETDTFNVTAEKTLSLKSNSEDLTLRASTDMTLDAEDITITGTGALTAISSDTDIM